MKYDEFSKFNIVIERDYPFSPHIIIDEECDFYMEPMVYTQLQGFKERHPDKYQLIIDSMIDRVKKNKHVVFVGDYESYFTEVKGYIYLEITDITNPLQIFVEDKSRGSDYGD